MRNRLLLSVALASVGLASDLAFAAAPVPEENPTGNTGALKAQIETGGSYDAHSGNGTRAVTDLHVPGALGMYGLDFTRYWNSVHNDQESIYPEWPIDFGASSWSHSWRWKAEQFTNSEEAGGGEETFTTSILVTFPDGHTTNYKVVRSNRPHGLPGAVQPPDPRLGPPYTEPEIAYSWPYGGVGVHDHICNMHPLGTEFWLCRADGGSVRFVRSGSKYLATEVFDPHGFRTDLTYNATGHLIRVEQEGGRYLALTWKYFTGGWTVITQVENGGNGGGGTQKVGYKYIRNGNFLVLAAVGYGNEPYPGQVTAAYYTYGFCYGDGVEPCSGIERSPFPLLKRADDPHFAGAMTKIRYDYAGHAVDCPPAPPWAPWLAPDHFQAEGFSIAAEKSGDTDQTVSKFFLSCGDGMRKETNGFGAWRIFNFGNSAETSEYPAPGLCRSYQLGKVTDFTNLGNAAVPSQRQNFIWALPHHVWDGRNIRTELSAALGGDTNEPGEILFADNSSGTYDRVNVIGTPTANLDPRMHNRYNHWLFKKTDENGNPTTYTRDARRRITRIESPGGAEEFSYNEWNQVVTHTLASGAVEHYVYDGFHRLEREWNEIDGEANATIYTYDSLDRVQTVSHPWSRAKGASFSVALTYNGRHQVIREEYPLTNGETTNPFKIYEYDSYGNCRTITDELGHRSEFTYDSYRRCTSYTEPLNAPAWNITGDSVASRHWEWVYDRYIDRVVPPNNNIVNEGFQASSHTSKEWRLQIEPVFNAAGHRRVSARKFDCNNRVVEESTGLIQVTAGNGQTGIQASPDTEVHNFTYDENGQKQTYKDPRGRITDYTYNSRNRLENVIEPKREDQTNRPTTTTEYDWAGNKTKVTFPDGRTQRWEGHDAFGQPARFFDEREKRTDLIYCWGPMKKLYKVTTHRDKEGGGSEPQLTTFSYDPLGRPTEILFPDGSKEITHYLFGQVDEWKTRRDEFKRIYYDARGREDYHTWDGNAAPGIDRVWDAANRLKSLSNPWSVIEYGYDDAGQVKWERNTVTGSGGPAQTNYYRYGNGEVAHLQYPNGTMVRRDYTARGQLERVWDSSGQQPVRYYYHKDGKVDRQDHSNGTTTAFGYDGRGMISSVHHKRVTNGSNLSYRDYWRDDRDRIKAWKKSSDSIVNPMENGRGDRYAYDEAGQLTTARYQAQNPQGNATSPERGDDFVYDALGNRKGGNNWVASRGQMLNFTIKENGLNQYSGWWPYNFIKYDDDIGGTWGTPQHANGTVMQEGWITAGFNALNQPIQIMSRAYNGTNNWMWFGFDPLGRCVKRWVSYPGGPDTGATYYYYDGWNLLQEGASPASAQRLYIHGARVDEIVKSINYTTSQSAWHHYDGRGHCTMLTGPNGEILEQYDYDAFGFPYFFDGQGNAKTFYDSPSNSVRGYSPYGNRFLFTGREWLTDLKLYDYRNRMYHPELGRFLQPDPKHFTAGDYNIYRYCHNDPVNKTDPTGLDAVRNADGTYHFVIRGDLVLSNLAGTHITNPNPRFTEQCATGGQFLTGTVAGGIVHDAPSTTTWAQGETVSRATVPGTLIARGWENGEYPSRAASSYGDGEPPNHVGIFLGLTSDGKIRILDQYHGPGGTIQERHYSRTEGWSVVTSERRYDRRRSDSAVRAFRYQRRPIGGGRP